MSGVNCVSLRPPAWHACFIDASEGLWRRRPGLIIRHCLASLQHSSTTAVKGATAVAADASGNLFVVDQVGPACTLPARCLHAASLRRRHPRQQLAWHAARHGWDVTPLHQILC